MVVFNFRMPEVVSLDGINDMRKQVEEQPGGTNFTHILLYIPLSYIFYAEISASSSLLQKKDRALFFGKNTDVYRKAIRSMYLRCSRL